MNENDLLCYAVINSNHKFLSADTETADWTSNVLEAKLYDNYNAAEYTAKKHEAMVIVFNLSIVSNPLSDI